MAHNVESFHRAARTLKQQVSGHLQGWLERSARNRPLLATTPDLSQDSLLVFMTEATGPDEVWAFVTQWLTVPFEGSLWLSVLTPDEQAIELRYSYPALSHPVTYRFTHDNNHLIDSFQSGDTTFCGASRQLGSPLMLMLGSPAPQFYFSVPLRAMGKTVAVLTLGFFQMDARSQQLVSKVYSGKEMIAQVLAYGLLRENVTHTAHFAVRDAEQQVAVQCLMAALTAKDPYTSGHSHAVGQYAEQLATQLCLTAEDVQAARLAAQLHDIGKLGIPDNVLKKPAALTPDEWLVMQQHPTIGANQILKPIPSLQSACQAVLHHHEHWDGSGYPHGLKGDAIPVGARIVSIVDAYHGLTSKRPYRKALSREETTGMLLEGAGRHWDPAMVHAFIHLLK